MVEDKKGVLFLCATPIGNLEDITLRALRVLREADIIAAEDTRRTRKLLSHYDIHTPLTSYHHHNRKGKGGHLLNMLASGKNIALVSDAGLPGVSDPGSELAASALEKGFDVVAVPGPSAGITALVVSGLSTDSFFFAGFLPASAGARRRKLDALSRQEGTLIFYEAPHRLRATLADMLDIFGDRPAALAKELTKIHEEVVRGSLQNILDYSKEKEPRGEFTIVVSGALHDELREKERAVRLRMSPAACVAVLEEGEMSRKEAIREAARLYDLPKKEVYRAVVESKKGGEK
ncbi:MAG TPA: 16S rRNA (cytidine(1402)-2'-O)-methyltransferase [Bacillota bacterium]|nr:16S rRNA (cytidine(1402)-2'-O)-methyltransferase [Bacillota bacterium]